MPYQLIESGKWFCKNCKDFSNDKYIIVHDHEMLVHCLPKGYFEWDKLLTRR